MKTRIYAAPAIKGLNRASTATSYRWCTWVSWGRVSARRMIQAWRGCRAGSDSCWSTASSAAGSRTFSWAPGESTCCRNSRWRSWWPSWRSPWRCWCWRRSCDASQGTWGFQSTEWALSVFVMLRLLCYTEQRQWPRSLWCWWPLSCCWRHACLCFASSWAPPRIASVSVCWWVYCWEPRVKPSAPRTWAVWKERFYK